MKPLHYLILLFALVFSSYGNGQNISRQKVNELLLKLKNSQADTSRLNVLVEIGKFHIYKQGEASNDLDSAFSYLLEAKELNTKLHDQNRENEIESILVIGYMERGDSVHGQTLFNQLIKDFRNNGYKEAEAALLLKMDL